MTYTFLPVDFDTAIAATLLGVTGSVMVVWVLLYAYRQAVYILSDDGADDPDWIAMQEENALDNRAYEASESGYFD